MPNLTPDDMRRLALIRLLLGRAEQESRLSAPFSTDSINRLHDVAEMFLALAVQINHRAIPKEFEKYWDVLEPVLGRPLTYRAQMQKFNKLRVNLKHFGIEPAAPEVESARAVVHGLIYDESPTLFGVEMNDVSLSSFISCVKAREFLESAEQRQSNGDALEAFADLSESFNVLIWDYKQRKLTGANRSIFDTTKDMRMLSPTLRRVQGKEKQFDEAVIASLEALDFAVTLVGLGVDMRRYGKFTYLAPTIYRSIGGDDRVMQDMPGIARSQADFDFCRDFVITTAIHLAEFDYDFDLFTAYFEEAQRRAKASDHP